VAVGPGGGRLATFGGGWAAVTEAGQHGAKGGGAAGWQQGLARPGNSEGG
jgi:hypothetical protein